jgi:acetate kinase
VDEPLRLPRGRAIALNAGSSSLKAALFADRSEIWRREAPIHPDDPESVERAVAELLDAFGDEVPNVVGHRVVHGGAQLHAPTEITDSVIAELEAATALAPLHQPIGVAVIRAARARLPKVHQVACFDTDFCWSLPLVASRLPIPTRFADRGIRRYGFHGLSYEYITRSFAGLLGARSVVAHLGSGSSLVALRHGVPLDTTMATTPLGGVVMSTRSGDLDPGAVCAIARVDGDIDATEHALAFESGLLALSGTSGDLAELVERVDNDDGARLAVDAYVASVAKTVAGFATVLGGLDTLVFTGGVGVHNAFVRTAVVERLVPLGLKFDARFVATNEERMIAWHALHTMSF